MKLEPLMALLGCVTPQRTLRYAKLASSTIRAPFDPWSTGQPLRLAAVEVVAAGPTRTSIESAAAAKPVVAPAAKEPVGAGASEQLVRAPPAEHTIGVGAADEEVGSASAVEAVSPPSAVEAVGGSAAGDHVAPGPTAGEQRPGEWGDGPGGAGRRHRVRPAPPLDEDDEPCAGCGEVRV